MKKKSKERLIIFAIITFAILAIIAFRGVASFGNAPQARIIGSNNSNSNGNRELFTLEIPYNITLIVMFDVEKPEIQLIDPTGEEINMENVRYRVGSNFIQYFLPNALVGTWTMTYDKLENTEIQTSYSVYMANIMIEEFTASLQQDEDGYIPIHFYVSADDPSHSAEAELLGYATEEDKFEYVVHAIIVDNSNNVLEEVILLEGIANLNEHTVRYIQLEEVTILSDRDFLMLRLSAYNRQGQASTRDTAWFDLRLVAYPSSSQSERPELGD